MPCRTLTIGDHVDREGDRPSQRYRLKITDQETEHTFLWHQPMESFAGYPGESRTYNQFRLMRIRWVLGKSEEKQMMTWLQGVDLGVKCAGVMAFFLSVWNFLAPRVRRVTLRFVPERQIQLLQEGKLSAFNMLCILTAVGPNTKWETLKFEKATVKAPDGRTVEFGCSAYIAEEGLGQKNASRNIPIPLQGGDSRTLTVAFQTSEFGSWALGTHEVSLFGRMGSTKQVVVTGIKFTLVQRDLDIIAKPKAIYMKALD